MADQSRVRSVFGRVVREPTFHFVLLAGLLFVTNALVGSRRRSVIEVDRGELAARLFQVEARWGAPVTPEIRRQIEDAYINEQVLVHEARALGLEDDERIHDVLAQKMLHVLSAEVIQPTDEELVSFYEARRLDYAPEQAVTVDEVVVGTADALPRALADQLRGGVPPKELTSVLPIELKVLSEVTLDGLIRILGSTTAEPLFVAETGTWIGPHHTVRGQHWFRVKERTRPVPQPLEAVREQVRLDWIAEEEANRLKLRVDELRSRYSIVFTGDEGTS